MPHHIAQEIRRATSGLRFGVHSRVNVLAWAHVTKVNGYDSDWALSWIVQGYPEPPAWMLCPGPTQVRCYTEPQRRWWMLWRRRDKRPECRGCEKL